MLTPPQFAYLLVALSTCWIGSASLAQEAEGEAPAKIDLVEPRTMRDWGLEALTRIQTDLAQPNGLYAEFGTLDGQRGADHGKYTFIWPASHQLQALWKWCSFEVAPSQRCRS